MTTLKYFGRFSYIPGSPVAIHTEHERGDFRVTIEINPDDTRSLFVKGLTLFGKPVPFVAGTEIWAVTDEGPSDLWIGLDDGGFAEIGLMSGVTSLHGCQLKIEVPIS